MTPRALSLITFLPRTVSKLVSRQLNSLLHLLKRPHQAPRGFSEDSHQYPEFSVDAEGRASAYLGRIVALTGATRVHDGYQLEISNGKFRNGPMQLQVCNGYIRRLRDVTASRCRWEQTCFNLKRKGMPRTEQIATALLQLRNNPALFDKWALQRDLPFKADGQLFRC